MCVKKFVEIIDVSEGNIYRLLINNQIMYLLNVMIAILVSTLYCSIAQPAVKGGINSQLTK